MGTPAALRRELTDLLDRGCPEPERPAIAGRPVFILAPESALGKLFVPGVLARLKNPVAMVDDISTAAVIHGIPRWSAFQFLQKAGAIRGALAIDFSASRFAGALFGRLALKAGVERVDFVAAHAEFGLPAVFETAPKTRAMTLAAIDRFLALEHRLADDLSRAVLYAALLLRINYDRAPLRDLLTGGEDEYFCAGPAGHTFRLGTNEAFCDLGAHIGLLTCKFLAATDWRYRAAHVYEPDRINYRALSKLRLLPLHDFRLRNKAVSDTRETLAFVESGSASSYVSDSGTSTCESVLLDDEIEELSFIKMDIEGFETRALRGARRIVSACSPRMAITAYHYPLDLPDIVDTLDAIRPGYFLRLRQHYNFYYDTVLYASPRNDWDPGETAS